MNQQPAPLISTLLTTRTFLLEYVIGGRLTQCHGTTVFVRPFSIPSTFVLWQPKGEQHRRRKPSRSNLCLSDRVPPPLGG